MLARMGSLGSGCETVPKRFSAGVYTIAHSAALGNGGGVKLPHGSEEVFCVVRSLLTSVVKSRNRLVGSGVRHCPPVARRDLCVRVQRLCSWDMGGRDWTRDRLGTGEIRRTLLGLHMGIELLRVSKISGSVRFRATWNIRIHAVAKEILIETC